MLPKPWIIDRDEERAPERPSQRMPVRNPDLMPDADPHDADAKRSHRGVSILDISPENPLEIAI